MNTIKNYFNLLRRFLPFLVHVKPYMKHVYMILLLIVVSTAAGLAPIYLQRQIFDYSIANGDLTSLFFILLAMLIANLFVFLFDTVYDYILSMIGEKISFAIKMQFYEHILHLPQTYYEKHSPSAIMKSYKDCSRVCEVVKIFLLDIVKNILLLLIYLPVISFISWKLTVLKLLVVPISLLITRYFKNRDKVFNNVVKDKEFEISKLGNDSVSSIRTIKSFGNEKQSLRRMKYNNLMMRKFSIMKKFNQYLSQAGKTLYDKFTHNFIYFIAAIDLIQGNLSFGYYMAFNALSGQAVGAFNGLLKVYYTLNEIVPALENYKNVDEIAEDRFENPNKEKKVDKYPVNGNLLFSNISFASEDKPLLKKVNLQVKPGMQVSLIGRKDSGKAALINMLLKLYKPDEGEIFLNNINIKDLNPRVLRRSFGLILQDHFFFNGTIRDNLTLGDNTKTDSQIWDALYKANALDFVLEYPDRINSYYGIGGIQFSRGEKQRLSIARAFLFDPDIIILDEAEKSFGADCENKIAESLRMLTRGKTTITIASKVSTLRKSDMICVFDNGEIVEAGRHNRLYEKQGLYYQLYNSSCTMSV